MQIPILSGIYSDQNADIRASYPRNLVPIPVDSGISAGYLRQAEGIVGFSSGPGIDRGGIIWRGVCYRVMGQSLVSVSPSGAITVFGVVAGSGPVTLDYSFEHLSISGGGNLYLFDGLNVTRVTDPDIGEVLDHIWIDGYFMTTDGENLVVTELNDPFAVNPLKYGSSESDPDSVVAMLKVRNEAYAVNRHTVEVFENIGGELFPFQRIEGAQIQKGAVGTHACCLYMEVVAFVGGGRNESIAVYAGANGQVQKLSTREIDKVLAGYSDPDISSILVEPRTEAGREMLYIHLPDQTLVFDGATSKAMQEQVWYTLTSSVAGPGQYRARNFVKAYGKWICGDASSFNLGELSDSVSSHFGEVNGWEFSTKIIYNESRGAIFHELELVSTAGAISGEPVVWSSYSYDGSTWSVEIARPAGRYGERIRRVRWLQNGVMSDRRIQRFRGTSDANISLSRLEAQLEPLNA